jgi:hypothetical protein
VSDVSVHNPKGSQYGQQDDRANYGYDQPADAESTDGDAKQSSGYPAANQGSDDTDDDISHSALLAVSMHDHRSYPSGQGSKDNPKDNIYYHLFLLN